MASSCLAIQLVQYSKRVRLSYGMKLLSPQYKCTPLYFPITDAFEC